MAIRDSSPKRGPKGQTPLSRAEAGGATSAWAAFCVALIRIKDTVGPGTSARPKLRSREFKTVQITNFKCFISFAAVVET